MNKLKTAILTIAILLSFSIALLQTGYIKTKMVSFIIERIEQKTGYRVSIGHISGIVPFRCTLHDFSLERNPSLTIGIDKLTASWWSPFSLISGTMKLSIVALDGITIKTESSESRIALPVKGKGNFIIKNEDFRLHSSMKLADSRIVMDISGDNNNLTTTNSITLPYGNHHKSLTIRVSEPWEAWLHFFSSNHELNGSVSYRDDDNSLSTGSFTIKPDNSFTIEFPTGSPLEGILQSSASGGNFSLRHTSKELPPIQSSARFFWDFDKGFKLHLRDISLSLSEVNHYYGNIDASIEGSAIHIDISEGIYENYNTGITARNISAHIIGDHSKFVLESLSATDNAKGHMSASGEIILATRKPYYNIPMQFNDFILSDNDLLYVIANGSILFHGSRSHPRLDGALTISKGKLTIPEKTSKPIQELSVIYLDEEEKTPRINNDPHLSVSIAITVPGNVYVKGYGLSAELHGIVNIIGTGPNIKLTGGLEALRGQFFFAGKAFDLREGNINACGSTIGEAYLNTVATLHVDTAAIEICLKGPLNSLCLSARSVPTMSTSEILSLVLFDTTIDEITPLQSIRLAQTMMTLSGKNSTPDIMGTIGKALELDSFDITNTNGNPEEASLKIGKYISKGTLVTIEKSITGDTDEFSITMDLSKQIKAEANINNNAESKIALKWQKDY